MILTDEQWQIVQPLLPAVGPRGRKGRPAIEQRKILDGILFRLITRRPWNEIPVRYGGWQTCFLHFDRWRKSGLMKEITNLLLRDVRHRGGFDFKDAVRSGVVQVIRADDRFRVLLPPEWFVLRGQDEPGLPGDWQLSTAMLYFQLVAYVLEKSARIAHRSDPLKDLYEPAHGRGG